MSRTTRRTLPALFVAAFVVLSSAAHRAEEGAEPLETEQQKLLYALGAALGHQLRELSLSPAEFEMLSEGLRDSALERDLRADPFEMREAAAAFRQERLVVRMERERAASRAFVVEAAREEGAVQTQSGMVLRELVAGSGPSPESTSVVKVHYHGTLRDGTVFDSTIPVGAPATFRLDRVIPCWREGVTRMKVGGKSRLVCPAQLAYGDGGFPPMVPPAAALAFEVELVEIVK